MADDLHYYTVLRLKPGASREEVRRQYRRLAKIYHPDRNPGEEEWCAEQLGVIKEAFEFLSDPARKIAYDRGIGAAPAQPQPTVSIVPIRSRPAKKVDEEPDMRRLLIYLGATLACIFAAAGLTTFAFTLTHPKADNTLTLPTLSVRSGPPSPNAPAPRPRHRPYLKTKPEAIGTVGEQRARLARLGIAAPNGFSALELKQMADRVQRYDAAH